MYLVPELLRSKTLPELEEEEKKLVKEFLEANGIFLQRGVDNTDNQTEKARMEEKMSHQRVALEDKINSFNNMCVELETFFEDEKKERIFKTRREDHSLPDTSASLDLMLDAIVSGKGMCAIHFLFNITVY